MIMPLSLKGETFTAPWPRAEKLNNDKTQTKICKLVIRATLLIIILSWYKYINYHLTSGFKEQLLWSTGKYALQV